MHKEAPRNKKSSSPRDIWKRKLVNRGNVPTQEPKRGIQIWSNDKWSLRERKTEREREREREREKGEQREKLRDQGFTMPVPNHFIDQKEACLAGWGLSVVLHRTLPCMLVLAPKQRDPFYLVRQKVYPIHQTILTWAQVGSKDPEGYSNPPSESSRLVCFRLVLIKIVNMDAIWFWQDTSTRHQRPVTMWFPNIITPTQRCPCRQNRVLDCTRCSGKSASRVQ